MVEVGKTSSRPFGMREYADINLFKPTFTGPHHKFTLLIPVSESTIGKGVPKTVFTNDDLDGLRSLLRSDFKGATYLVVDGPPPIQGDWVNQKGDVVVDWHVRAEVYTQRYVGAIEYFEELKARLLIHVREVRQAEQEEIIMEQTEVDFIRQRPLEAIIMESEERLKKLRK